MSTRFRDLSTVDACSSHGIGNHSSACRYAVSLGLMIYYPYGPMGTSQFLSPPEELSARDILTPTPGWLPPDAPASRSPAKDARTMAREWAESLLMTDHLVAHASRWMMTFHDSFLNKSAATSTLRHTRRPPLSCSSNTLYLSTEVCTSPSPAWSCLHIRRTCITIRHRTD